MIEVEDRSKTYTLSRHQKKMGPQFTGDTLSSFGGSACSSEPNPFRLGLGVERYALGDFPMRGENKK